MHEKQSNHIGTITGKTIGEVWRLYCDHVLSQGVVRPDDKEDILESAPLLIEILDPSVDDPFVLRHGDQHVIEIYTKKMYSMDIITELNSTYGDRIFLNCGVDQFKWMIDRLRTKWWTKAASISLLKPNDPGPRIPCLTQIQFLQRDGKINAHCTFRSQNVFRSYGNFLGIKSLLDKASKELDVPAGRIIVFISCPHIYISDREKAKQISEFAI